MRRSINDAKQLEAWFKAFKAFEITTETMLSQKDDHITDRTPPARVPGCVICGCEKEDLIHQALLQVFKGHTSIEKVSHRYDYPIHKLQAHLKTCMNPDSRSGSFVASSVEYLRTPAGRIRVLSIKDMIERAPKGTNVCKTSLSESGRRIDTTICTWGFQEHLKCLFHGNETRETLLDGEHIRREGVVKTIAESLEWLIEALGVDICA
jgi:hypothetical protein